MEKTNKPIPLAANTVGVPKCSATAPIGATPKGARLKVIMLMLNTRPRICSSTWVWIKVIFNDAATAPNMPKTNKMGSAVT